MSAEAPALPLSAHPPTAARSAGHDAAWTFVPADDAAACHWRSRVREATVEVGDTVEAPKSAAFPGAVSVAGVPAAAEGTLYEWFSDSGPDGTNLYDFEATAPWSGGMFVQAYWWNGPEGERVQMTCADSQAAGPPTGVDPDPAQHVGLHVAFAESFTHEHDDELPPFPSASPSPTPTVTVTASPAPSEPVCTVAEPCSFEPSKPTVTLVLLLGGVSAMALLGLLVRSFAPRGS